MLKGKTKSGFAFDVSDETLNNYELLEALSEVDENSLKLPRVVDLLLGDQKKKLFDHMRQENGIVPTDAIFNELMEIFQSGKQTKNS